MCQDTFHHSEASFWLQTGGGACFACGTGASSFFLYLSTAIFLLFDINSVQSTPIPSTYSTNRTNKEWFMHTWLCSISYYMKMNYCAGQGHILLKNPSLQISSAIPACYRYVLLGDICCAIHRVCGPEGVLKQVPLLADCHSCNIQLLLYLLLTNDSGSCVLWQMSFPNFCQMLMMLFKQRN